MTARPAAEFRLNGEPRPCKPGMTIAELLEELGATGPGVAVERNQEVVPRAQHAGTVIQPGDRVEVVRLVGGG